MTKAEFKRFSVSWQAAQKVYGKSAEADSLALVFKVLEPYELADVENALGAHLRDPECGQYAPKPADIVRKIEGKTEERVALAWAHFRECTRSGRMPQDDTLCTVIRRMGGLEYLGDKTSRDLDFMQKQFAALWLASCEPVRLGIAAMRRPEAIA